MKKVRIGCLIVVLIPVLLLCALIIPRSNTKNADAVISSDYSTITYKDEIYVPVQLGDLPEDVAKSFISWSNVETLEETLAKVEATVEKQNYFLDKYFFTNEIVVYEYENEIFIYLYTDYDVNESDYYCSQSYKNTIKIK